MKTNFANDKLNNSPRFFYRPYIFLSCFSMLAMALLSLVQPDTIEKFWLLKCVQNIGTFGAGLYCSIQINKLIKSATTKSQSLIISVLKISCIAFILLIIFFIFFDVKLIWSALTIAIFFWLSSFVVAGYNEFIEIPEKEYKSWKPKQNYLPKAGIFLNSINISFNIDKNISSKEILIIKTVVQPYKTLGMVFNELFIEHLNERKNNREFFNEEGKLYSWEFYKKKTFLNVANPLDPEIEIQYTNLKEGDVIYAKRIKFPVTKTNSTNSLSLNNYNEAN